MVPATEDDKPIVRRLLELNSYEFSEIDGRDLGPHGEYGYRFLDHYWVEGENRHPFIVRTDGAIAGCVRIRAGSPHRFGGFLIVRKFRRNGVGTTVARVIFRQFPGEWLVEEIQDNDAAVAFFVGPFPLISWTWPPTSGTVQEFVAS